MPCKKNFKKLKNTIITNKYTIIYIVLISVVVFIASIVQSEHIVQINVPIEETNYNATIKYHNAYLNVSAAVALLIGLISLVVSLRISEKARKDNFNNIKYFLKYDKAIDSSILLDKIIKSAHEKFEQSNDLKLIKYLMIKIAKPILFQTVRWNMIILKSILRKIIQIFMKCVANLVKNIIITSYLKI